jgi:hypothetical protein
MKELLNSVEGFVLMNKEVIEKLFTDWFEKYRKK